MGLPIDSESSWFFHVSDPCKKLSRTLIVLITMFPLLYFGTTMMVYYELLFYSSMSYSVELWVAHQVFPVQRRAIRIKQITLSNSCEGAFRELGLLTLPSLYYFRVVLAFLSVIGDLQPAVLDTRYPHIRTHSHHLTPSQTQ